MGHMPGGATVGEYNAIIRGVLTQSDSLVYHYPFAGTDYYAASGEVGAKTWLVIFGRDGFMETAFPPDDPAEYMTKRGFAVLGPMGEVCP